MWEVTEITDGTMRNSWIPQPVTWGRAKLHSYQRGSAGLLVRILLVLPGQQLLANKNLDFPWQQHQKYLLDTYVTKPVRSKTSLFHTLWNLLLCLGGRREWHSPWLAGQIKHLGIPVPELRPYFYLPCPNTSKNTLPVSQPSGLRIFWARSGIYVFNSTQGFFLLNLSDDVSSHIKDQQQLQHPVAKK